VSAVESPTLLVVDDDEAFRAAIGGALERRGFAVSLAAGLAAALELAKQKVFEYALIDMRMPGGSGTELVRAPSTMWSTALAET